jgi:hypothetical protein
MGKNFTVSAGKSIAIPVNLAGPSASSVTVALSCQTSSPSITCAISPTSAAVAGNGSASLTVNAYTTSTTSSSANTRPARRGFVIGSAGGFAFAVLVFCALPARRRRSNFFVLLMLAVAFAGFAGCGGSSHSVPPPPPVQTIVPAPPGSYTVTVTGASTGITHNSTVYLQVQ